MSTKTILAIIPIKEHSERVPGKNVRDFNGKPLFWWIIQTLKQIPQINDIVIDTDSKDIVKRIKRYFALRFSIRPDYLRGDFVSVNKLIEYILETNPDYHYFLQTHVTNPLLNADTLKSAIDEFFGSEKEIDSLFSVTPHYARFYDADHEPVNHNPLQLQRTQDLQPLYEENSNFYLFSRASFNLKKNRIGNKPALFSMNKMEAIDIDNEEDFVMAEKIQTHLTK
jgi:N-acylneuraminate cytidylyltransferase